MTQEEFIGVLNSKGDSYKIEGDKIIVTADWDVFLRSLTTLPPGVVFENGGYVYLDSLETLPPGVEFKNSGWVRLKSLIGGQGWFIKWSGNIEGIDSKTLLNHMISKGIFI